jgi:hypothetical protein
VVECIPVFKDKSEPRPQHLPVVYGISALSETSKPGTWQLPEVKGTSALNH